jgi:hypothetical protein
MEVVGGTAAKPSPATYDQPKPFLKDAKERERWREVERSNKVIASK